MSELFAALLRLAREVDDPVEDPCDAVQIVRDCLERHQPLARQRRTDHDDHHDRHGGGSNRSSCRQ
jgi:hypothetical protein